MPRKARLTKEQLAKEADLQLRENARNLLKNWFKAVDQKIAVGDNRTIEMVGRMFAFDKGPGGVTIFNQHLQVNGVSQESGARVRSFDQIIAKLEEKDNVSRQQRMLEAPVENSEEEDDDEEGDEDIQDAEIEDVPAPVEA